MNFDNPHRFDCPGCATPLTVPLEDIVGLQGRCPRCGHSFRELGLSMRRHANRLTAFFVAWEAVWIFEARYEFSAEDDEVEALETPGQLVAYVQARSGGQASTDEVLVELASRIRRPLDASHLDTPLTQLVPEPASGRA